MLGDLEQLIHWHTDKKSMTELEFRLRYICQAESRGIVYPSAALAPSPYRLTSLTPYSLTHWNLSPPPSMPWAARLTETPLPLMLSPGLTDSGCFSSLGPEVKVTSTRRASGAPNDVGRPRCESHPNPCLLSQHSLSSVLECMISLTIECLLQKKKK